MARPPSTALWDACEVREGERISAARTIPCPRVEVMSLRALACDGVGYSAHTVACFECVSLGISVTLSNPCFLQPSRKSHVFGSQTGNGS